MFFPSYQLQTPHVTSIRVAPSSFVIHVPNVAVAMPQAPNSLFVASDIDSQSSIPTTHLRGFSHHATVSAVQEIQPHNFDELSNMVITSVCLDITVNLSQRANELGTEHLSHVQKPWKSGKLTSAKLLDKFAATLLPPTRGR